MKRHLLFCLLPILMAAQAAAPEVEITNEPHHHLTLENKSVRVFNVEVDPNTQTLMHWHRHDYIAINLGPAEIENNVKGKPPATAKLPDGDVRFASASFAHFVRDVADYPFRNVTVEILDDANLRNSTAKWDPANNEDRGLDVLTNGTKQILFVKDGIRATEFELQPGGIVPSHHHAGPHLFVAVTDLDILAAPRTTRPEFLLPARLKSGDSKWLPGNYSQSITNTGPTSAKFVTLEFP
jgi:hypothetical protein